MGNNWSKHLFCLFFFVLKHTRRLEMWKWQSALWFHKRKCIINCQQNPLTIFLLLTLNGHHHNIKWFQVSTYTILWNINARRLVNCLHRRNKNQYQSAFLFSIGLKFRNIIRFYFYFLSAGCFFDISSFSMQKNKSITPTTITQPLVNNAVK